MNNTEIKSMTEEELMSNIKSEKETLQRLKFAHAVSSVENPMKIRATRRYIAQLQTELRARQLAQK
jgi:large subunit ribosomal protein L29